MNAEENISISGTRSNRRLDKSTQREDITRIKSRRINVRRNAKLLPGKLEGRKVLEDIAEDGFGIYTL